VQVVPGRASGIEMVGMAEVGAPISQDGVAVHPDFWCVCLCYLHFAPENPEDGKQRYDIWVSPRGRPHMPTQPETQHNPLLGCRVILMMTHGLTDCGKAGDLGLVLGMLTD